MTQPVSYTLSALAKHVNGTVKGNENCTVHRLATLASASSGELAFLANPKYVSQLESTSAAAIILNEDAVGLCRTNAIVVKDPYVAFAKIAQLMDTTPAPAACIEASAVVSPEAVIGANVCIGANAVIESGAVLADDVVIGANCFIGKQAHIGKGTKLWSNVSVYHSVIIGEYCLVQANTVIGSDGFGYAREGGRWIKIPQLGSVKIGNRVEIGASTTIDRGALDDTIIEDGVVIDNQIQIAHNVVIGENTAMAACSVVAGSTVVGKNCTFAGLVGVNGHIQIADNTMLTGRAMVTKSITEAGVYSSGMPVLPNKEWRKNTARLKNIDAMHKRIATLEQEIKELKRQSETDE